jgi:hypothetical protein
MAVDRPLLAQRARWFVALLDLFWWFVLDLATSVGDHVYFFEGDEAFFYHFVEDWDEAFDFFAAVDDFDDDWDFVGDALFVDGVDEAVGAVAHDAAQDGCAGEAFAACFFDDLLVEGFAVPLVVFIDKHPEHLAFAFDLHWGSFLPRNHPHDLSGRGQSTTISGFSQCGSGANSEDLRMDLGELVQISTNRADLRLVGGWGVVFRSCELRTILL